MKIDEKTLSILGAPKEGFEWVEKKWPDDLVEGGVVAFDCRGDFVVYPTDEDAGGIIRGTGKFYQQVPIEPEPEVIPVCEWFQVSVTGIGPVAEFRDTINQPWRGSNSHAHDGIATFIATQHKELKALKEKLGEIKKEACYLQTVRQNAHWNLVEKCRALEVE